MTLTSDFVVRKVARFADAGGKPAVEITLHAVGDNVSEPSPEMTSAPAVELPDDFRASGLLVLRVVSRRVVDAFPVGARLHMVLEARNHAVFAENCKAAEEGVPV